MNTLSALVHTDGKEPSLLQSFYLKTGEKLTKKQMKEKIDAIESDLISLGSKLIMAKIMDENTAPEFIQDELLDELQAEDTDTAERTNKLIQWVHQSATENTVADLTRYLVKLSTEATQLEVISRYPLTSQLN